MLAAAFKALFPVQKPVRRLFEDRLRAAAQALPNDSLVLDFASAGNRYRHFFDHCRYVGGDIEVVSPLPPLDERTRFVQADFNANPFARGRYDAVVTTNSINYAGSDAATIRRALDALLETLKPDGCFMTMVTLDWEHAGDYLGWIDERFETVAQQRYDGILSRALAYAVLYGVTRRPRGPLRKLNAAVLRVASTLALPLLRHVGDLYGPRTRYAVFVTARGMRNPSPADTAPDADPDLKSPLGGGPLYALPDGSLTDGAALFPVTDSVPRLLPESAMAPPQAGVAE